MPKPILVIKTPFISDAEYAHISLLIEEEVGEEYYVLIVKTDTRDDWSFECFYEKDFNHVKYEELKELIINEVKV